MKQEPVMEQLLPLAGEHWARLQARWDYIYEPDAKRVLDQVLTRYIEALIYQAVVENMALRAVGAYGGDESGLGQCRKRDRRVDTDLQQDAAGSDHQGAVGNRGRRSGSMTLLPMMGDTLRKALVMGRPNRLGAAEYDVTTDQLYMFEDFLI